MSKPQILIVEDDRIVAEGIKDSLEKLGYVVAGIASSGERALTMAQDKKPDLMLMDIVLKGEMDGIEAAENIRSRFGIPVVFLTAYADEEKLERAKITEPFGYLIKPFQNRELKVTIEMALYKANTDAERKQAVEALRKSEEKYRTLFEAESDALFMVDAETADILESNEAATRLYGYSPSEFKGLKAMDLSAEPEKTSESIRRASSKTSVSIRYHKKKDETVFPVEISANYFTHHGRRINISAIRDISERMRLEARLREAQKIEAIGTLAGGIAHEFNNALTSVMGNVELLAGDLPQNEDLNEYIDAIKTASQRMAGLTKQLLAYARGGRYRDEIVSLSDFVEERLTMLKSNVDPSLRVETDLARDIFKVKADLTQVQMVISTLVDNAAEAVENEGRIRISTSSQEIDEAFAQKHPDLNPGAYVCLTVADDGKGMDPETVDKIFDPFFSTKFLGRGLGMAAAHGIIVNHAGAILIDSKPGKGTSVRIYLPAVRAEEDRTEEKLLKKPEFKVSGATGTILVIEDEELVMNTIRSILKKLGYRVLEAKTGNEAIDMVRTFDEDIDLALLDIKLPDISGDRLYPIIMEARPNLKVIVCSGYALDGPVREILNAGAEAFIQKPFSIAQISEKLKAVLDQRD